MRAALDARVQADHARIKEIGRTRAHLTMQRAAGVYALSDYEAALTLLADEAEEIRERTSANEAALRNLRRGTDLGTIVPLIDALRAWAAPAPRRGQGAQRTSPAAADSGVVEATKTRLQYLFDRLTIHPQEELFTATWAPDIALLLGQEETIVPCKARRARPRP